MMYTDEQRTFQGGSGAGCSASVFASYVLRKLESGELNKVLFAPTGALLSPLSSQQGDSIPGICHAFTIISPKYNKNKEENKLNAELLSSKNKEVNINENKSDKSKKIKDNFRKSNLTTPKKSNKRQGN